MREVGLEIIEDGDKYYMLVPLYNEWRTATAVLSTGNTEVPEFKELVDYCKQNKTEMLHFFLDLIDCFEYSHKQGTRADNYVGFFLQVLDECFPDMFTVNGYISGTTYQKMWQTVAVALLSGQMCDAEEILSN